MSFLFLSTFERRARVAQWLR